VIHEGAPVSSTRVREALARGAVGAARAMLGRRYFVDGRVIPGAGRGRTLGFPTANLGEIGQALPGAGVYACWCRQPPGPGGDVAPAVVNVGRRPTFGGGDTHVEAHLLDRATDLYGKPLRLEFVERLREERKFAGADALSAQIRIDAADARRVLGEAVTNAV
jgi:riboflavin kinase/FMN adenylyltransferase